MTSSPSVQAPLEFIPPRFNPWVCWLSYATLPVTLRLRLRPWLPAGIEQVEVHNSETLVQLFHQFQSGKIRLLIAFRHVEVDDPLCMGYMFSHTLPQVARRLNLPLEQPVHSHFMYDRGMSLWAGAWLKGFFADLGGIPVRRGRRMDLKAIKAARRILVDGRFPLTIAPEGATNGHGEVLSPLEPGVAQMAFWGLQDLKQQQRSEAMVVLPISVRYRYPCPNWKRLDQLLLQLERDCGLVPAGQSRPSSPLNHLAPQPFHNQLLSGSQQNPSFELLNSFYQRLLHIGIKMLSITAQIYRQFYHVTLPEPIRLEDLIDQLSLAAATSNKTIAHHLAPLLDEMLKVGERYFGIPSTGDLPSRCRKLEEAGWSRIYRDDINDVNTLSSLEKGLSDRIAAESELYMGHMRLVESLVAVSGHYVKDNPSFERFAETSLILFDVMERIKGVAVPCRPRLGWRHCHIAIGKPINIGDRWHDYSKSRQAGKQAIDRLTENIGTELERLMRNTPRCSRNVIKN